MTLSVLLLNLKYGIQTKRRKLCNIGGFGTTFGTATTQQPNFGFGTPPTATTASTGFGGFGTSTFGTTTTTTPSLFSGFGQTSTTPSTGTEINLFFACTSNVDSYNWKLF